MPSYIDLNEYYLQCFIEHFESISDNKAEAIDFMMNHGSHPSVVKEWIIDACLEMETISDSLKSAIIETIDYDWIANEIKHRVLDELAESQ
jgi:hypothetical protein